MTRCKFCKNRTVKGNIVNERDKTIWEKRQKKSAQVKSAAVKDQKEMYVAHIHTAIYNNIYVWNDTNVQNLYLFYEFVYIQFIDCAIIMHTRTRSLFYGA